MAKYKPIRKTWRPSNLFVSARRIGKKLNGIDKNMADANAHEWPKDASKATPMAVCIPSAVSAWCSKADLCVPRTSCWPIHLSKAEKARKRNEKDDRLNTFRIYVCYMHDEVIIIILPGFINNFRAPSVRRPMAHNVRLTTARHTQPEPNRRCITLVGRSPFAFARGSPRLRLIT